jgi:hypothetical protein
MIFVSNVGTGFSIFETVYQKRGEDGKEETEGIEEWRRSYPDVQVQTPPAA